MPGVDADAAPSHIAAVLVVCTWSHPRCANIVHWPRAQLTLHLDVTIANMIVWAVCAPVLRNVLGDGTRLLGVAVALVAARARSTRIVVDKIRGLASLRAMPITLVTIWACCTCIVIHVVRERAFCRRSTVACMSRGAAVALVAGHILVARTWCRRHSVASMT